MTPFHTINLRDDRSSSKPLASAPSNSAVASERLDRPARYSIYTTASAHSEPSLQRFHASLPGIKFVGLGPNLDELGIVRENSRNGPLGLIDHVR